MNNKKYGKGKGKVLPKIEKISGGKAHSNTRKPMITDFFLNQKRVNVCEHMVKMASCESFWTVPQGVTRGEGGERGVDGRKIKCKLAQVYTRSVFRGQNELIGKFKMVAGDAIRV